jgi:putative spermidine/putrescine transport system permease protein
VGNSRNYFLRFFVTPALLCAGVLIAALLAILSQSLQTYIPGSLNTGPFTFANFADLENLAYPKAFLLTAWISLQTAFFSLLVGYPLASALVRARSAWVRSTILIICITPLFLGEVVRTYSWIILLGTQGFFNAVLLKLGLITQPLQMMFTSGGVIAALVHVTLPIMVIMLAAAISHIDRDCERAAAGLGAGPIRVFFTITLPLSAPGIIAGTTTAFAWTFSAFATPQLIGGGQVIMIANLVYDLGYANSNFPFAAAISVVGLAFTLVILLLLWMATDRMGESR